MDFFEVKRNKKKYRTPMLLLSVAFGFFMMFIFSGKSRVDIESIAVSSNEQYVACFETGNGHKIRCFSKEGSMVFCYNIPTDISAGGHCSLWFEDELLCVFFYRTEKIAHLALDGTLRDISEYMNDDTRSEYDSFTRKGSKYVYEGSTIDVIYQKNSPLGYWLLGLPRYLAITPKNTELKILLT